MVPLLACSILAVAVVIERAWFGWCGPRCTHETATVSREEIR
jgi:hypothetical protein